VRLAAIRVCYKEDSRIALQLLYAIG